jgi:hypothetical protein
MTEIIGLNGLPLLTRQLAWNCLPCDTAPRVLTRMGLVPPSEEGIEAEHDEAHARKNELRPIASVLGSMVGLTADLLATAILEDTSERSYSEEERAALTIHYQTVILQSSIGLIAQLVHMNVLAVTVGGAGEFLG